MSDLKPQTHYYGDTIRGLFMLSGVIMIGTLPFFTNLVPAPSLFSIIALIVLVLLSGLVNPRQKNLILITLLVSIVAFVIFEYHALKAAQSLGVKNPFFVVNEALALIFFSTIYFGTKSLRGFLLKG